MVLTLWGFGADGLARTTTKPRKNGNQQSPNNRQPKPRNRNHNPTPNNDKAHAESKVSKI